MASNLITATGYRELQRELEYLWREQRPAVTEKVSWAASLGDRSENADYKENKRLLRQIDSRIRHIRKRLAQVRIVYPSAQQEGRVFFGARVTIENEQGEQKTLHIVGPDEIYGRDQVISIDAPLARALLKKQTGEEAEVVTPAGFMRWTIVAIGYHR